MARSLWETWMGMCTLLAFLPLLPLHLFPTPTVQADGPARTSVTLPLPDRKALRVVPGVPRPVVQALEEPPTSFASLLKTPAAILKSVPRLYHNRRQPGQPRQG